MASRFHTTWIVLGGILLVALPLAAQVTIGDNLSLGLNGTVSANYAGSYGNEIDSSHGLGFGGTAALTGFYYNPNFISFNVDPYYNQSRSNSNFGSVTDASGVTLSSAIFSGSHFPGSVNYTKAFNTTGNYGVPGIAGLNTNGDSQSFGVNWSALFPDWPTLNAGYQQGSENYSLYGTNQNGNSNFRSIYLNSNYTIHGFNLGAGFADGTSQGLIPGVLVDGNETNSNSDTKSFTASLGHALPWHGSFCQFLQPHRSQFGLPGLQLQWHHRPAFCKCRCASDAEAELLAWRRLHRQSERFALPGNFSHDIRPIESKPLQLNIRDHDQFHWLQWRRLRRDAVERRVARLEFPVQQRLCLHTEFSGNGRGRTQGADLSGCELRLPPCTAAACPTRARSWVDTWARNVNVFDSTIDGQSSNQLGFNVNVNYNRQIGAWQVGGYFNYAQNVQTLLVTYQQSFYYYSGSVARRFGRLFWNANASAGRTGLSAVPGSSSGSESFGTSIGSNRLSLTANYNKTNGNALAGGNGLVTTPLPPIIPPSLLLFYGGESYGATLSASPIRHLQASISYVNARSDITNQGIASWNRFEEKNAYVNYQFRQIGIQGGYTQFTQGFSASGKPPASLSSFSIGIYRWFNFF